MVTFALFVWFGALVGLGWLWWVGLALTAVAFAYQHVVVTPNDLSRVNRAFFTANGFVGIALFVFAAPGSAYLTVRTAVRGGLRASRVTTGMRNRGSSASPAPPARRTPRPCCARCSTPASPSTWSSPGPPG